MISLRKLIAVVCLAAILFALAAPGSSGLLLGILAPLVLFFLEMIGILIPRIGGHRAAPSRPFFPAFAPRPPPLN
jgi:hypothetical protein